MVFVEKGTCSAIVKLDEAVAEIVAVVEVVVVSVGSYCSRDSG